MLQNDGASVNLLFRSFGFKHGIPVDTDFVFDLRCLPNPHWQPALRPLSGLHEEVAGYLATQPLVNEMFEDIAGYLERWIPRLLITTGYTSLLALAALVDSIAASIWLIA